MPSEPISFGILLYNVQALDLVGPMDVLSNAQPANVSKFGPLLPGADLQDMQRRSLDFTFHYPGPSMSPVQLSGGLFAMPTCTYDDCPKLDYLLIGGPDPDVPIKPGLLPPEIRDFIRRRAPECKILFTTCSGSLTLASTGLLDNVEATVNHACVSMAREAFPKVRWTAEKNWIEGEKYWTSSGAVAGMDMLFRWLKQEGGADLADLTTMLLDYQPRDIDGKPMSYVNGSGKRM